MKKQKSLSNLSGFNDICKSEMMKGGKGACRDCYGREVKAPKKTTYTPKSPVNRTEDSYVPPAPRPPQPTDPYFHERDSAPYR